MVAMALVEVVVSKVSTDMFAHDALHINGRGSVSYGRSDTFVSGDLGVVYARFS